MRSKTQQSAPVAELSDETLTAVVGGLSIIQNPDGRVPEGVSFEPKEPATPEPPRPPIIPPFPWQRVQLPLTAD